MAEHIAYFNGEYVPDSQVRIDPNDWGFRYGYTVYDAERTYDGKIFRLRDHIERFFRSLKYTRIDIGLTVEEMMSISEETARRNEHLREPGGDFSVRQFATPGKGIIGDVQSVGPPTVCVMVSPMPLKRYIKSYESGASVVLSKVRSYSSDSLDPKIKHYSRMNMMLAEFEAADIDPNAHTVLLDQQGNVSEEVRGNIMIVTDGRIRTTRLTSALKGVSRQVNTQLAEQLGIEVVNEDLQPYDLYTADEVFLTTSDYGVLPVGTVDKRRIGTEVPGPISKQLMAAWSELVGLDIVDQAINSPY